VKKLRLHKRDIEKVFRIRARKRKIASFEDSRESLGLKGEAARPRGAIAFRRQNVGGRKLRNRKKKREGPISKALSGKKESTGRGEGESIWVRGKKKRTRSEDCQA